jgi:glycosyltransferase involved in cell wall biosynthesis
MTGTESRPGPLRVMLLSLEYTPALNGGVGTHVYELSCGLAKENHAAQVLTYTPGAQTTVRGPNAEIHFIPSGVVNLLKAARSSMTQGILAFNDDLVAYGQKLIESQKQPPDIIAYFNWITFRAATQLGEIFKIPVLGRVSFLHEPTERWWGQTPDPEMVEQEKALFSRSRDLITISDSMLRLIHNAYVAPKERLHLIHNGLDPRPFQLTSMSADKVASLRRTIATKGEKIAIFAGRLNPQKGLIQLIRSAAQVIKEFPNVRYLIAGETDSQRYGDEIQTELARHTILRDKMKFLGKLSRRHLAILYQSVDLAVMPSIFEPFGNVVIESMAAGAPVVATDQGGFHDVVRHGETGLLVPVNEGEAGIHTVDPGLLASAQLTLLKDEALAKTMGAAGRRRVLSEFNLEKMTRLTVRAYRKVISEFSGLNHGVSSDG